MAEKPAGKSAEPKNPVKIPQPHGGALLSGGVPGNRGGRNGGRPPEAFRALTRRIISNRKLVHRMADIAEAKIGEIVETEDGKQFTETPLREQRGAMDTLFKIGIGAEKGLQESVIQERLELTIQLLEELPDEIRGAYLKRLRAIWKGKA